MKRKFVLLILIIIILLGAYLRLSKLNLTLVEGDQVRDLRITQNMIENKELRLKGVTQDESNMPTTFGPLMYYLLAIPMLFSKSAVFISGFIALLNVIAIFFAFKLGNDFFGTKIGLISAAFMAVNPWAIYYSRFIWNSNFLPLFAIIFVYSIFAVVLKNKQQYFILSFAMFACMLQLHMSALALAPLIIIVLVYKIFVDKNLKWHYFIASMCVALVLFTPYIYDNVSTNFESFKEQFIYGTSNTPQLFLTQIKECMGLPTMLATNYLGHYIYGDTQVFTKPFNLIFMATTILCVIMLIIGSIYILQNIKTKKYVILMLWLAIPPLLFLIYLKNISPHYFIILYPAQFIVLASLSNIKKYKTFIMSILIALIILQFTYSFMFLNSINTLGGTTGTYGNTYQTKLDVINYANQNHMHLVTYGSNYTYILTSENIRVNYVVATSITQLDSIKKPYVLAVDRLSRYGLRFSETPKETAYFNALSNKKMFGLVEVYYIET